VPLALMVRIPRMSPPVHCLANIFHLPRQHIQQSASRFQLHLEHKLHYTIAIHRENRRSRFRKPIFRERVYLPCELQQEFNHVRSWAANNRLILNLSKTKEMVFKQPRVRCFHMPAALDDVEQIDCCKLLGVIFQSNFKLDSHVNYLLSQCVQRMYILKLLRHQGMSSQTDYYCSVCLNLILNYVCTSSMGRISLCCSHR